MYVNACTGITCSTLSNNFYMPSNNIILPADLFTKKCNKNILGRGKGLG